MIQKLLNVRGMLLNMVKDYRRMCWKCREECFRIVGYDKRLTLECVGNVGGGGRNIEHDTKVARCSASVAGGSGEK